MVHKPEIQYVGQFYVYGSEAKKLAVAPKPQKTRKPETFVRPQQERTVMVDPVALVGMVLAVVMLIALAVGAVQITSTWQEYDAVESYLTELKKENFILEHTYHSSYNLEEIETIALAMGMIPATEAKVLPVDITVPEPQTEPTLWDNTRWFVKELLGKN